MWGRPTRRPMPIIIPTTAPTMPIPAMPTATRIMAMASVSASVGAAVITAIMVVATMGTATAMAAGTAADAAAHAAMAAADGNTTNTRQILREMAALRRRHFFARLLPAATSSGGERATRAADSRYSLITLYKYSFREHITGMLTKYIDLSLIHISEPTRQA